jgi:adenylate kinase family enzyme
LLGCFLDAQPLHARRGHSLTLVELFAIPGAGKTTAVKAVAERALVTTRKDLSAEWANCSVLQRLAHIGRAFGKRRRLATAARFCRGARIATPEGVFRLMRLLAKTDWLRSRRGVVLLDQGFLQDLWSILLAGRSACADPALLAPLIRDLYEGIDATIVIIAVDPETASARVRGRTNGNSRFDGLPAGELRTSLYSASELHRQVAKAATLAGLPVRIIDGSAPSDIVADQLLSLLPAAGAGRCAGGPSQRPRRISVVGSTGSGKTHLARELADRLSLPISELDELRRDAAASGSLKQAFEARVAELAQSDEWIIDGHYRDVRHLIWCRSELIIWLNYPLPLVALRLMRRFSRKRRAIPFHLVEQWGKPHTTAYPANEGVSWRRRVRRLAKTLGERGEYGRLLRSAEYRNVRVVELRSLQMTRRWLQGL